MKSSSGLVSGIYKALNPRCSPRLAKYYSLKAAFRLSESTQLDAHRGSLSSLAIT